MNGDLNNIIAAVNEICGVEIRSEAEKELLWIENIYAYSSRT